MTKNSGGFISTFNEVMIEPDDFLKIKETLTRIGVHNKEKDTLNQTCHILHKKGKYYIVHFKELYRLDGRRVAITKNDLIRRDKITKVLEDWGMLKTKTKLKYHGEKCYFYVVKYDDKENWTLNPNYNIGVKKDAIA